MKWRTLVCNITTAARGVYPWLKLKQLQRNAPKIIADRLKILKNADFSGDGNKITE